MQPPNAPPENFTPHGTPHLSVSQLNMYLRCSLQWYYRYVLGWIERPKLPLANGKAGHAAVEWNTKQKIATGADQRLDEILDKFSDAYDAETEALDPYDASPADIGRTKDETAQTLTVWRMKDAPTVEPLGAEIEFTLDIPQAEDGFVTPVVVGRIDEAQTRGILDNKFKGRMPSNGQAETDTSLQLSTYDASMAAKGIELPSVGLRIFVPPLKTVEPRVVTLWRDPKLLRPTERMARRERVVHNFRTMWRAIKAGIFMPTDDPMTCNRCGFRERCQSSLVRQDLAAIQSRQKEIA